MAWLDQLWPVATLAAIGVVACALEESGGTDDYGDAVLREILGCIRRVLGGSKRD